MGKTFFTILLFKLDLNLQLYPLNFVYLNLCCSLSFKWLYNKIGQHMRWHWRPAKAKTRLHSHAIMYVHLLLTFTKYGIQSLEGTKMFQYCTCPAGRVTCTFHLSCKHMHLSFKSECNREHKVVICSMTS